MYLQVATRGLCAIAQAESLRYKLIGGLAVRRACYGVLRFIMESGAKGCEVVVSGKLRGQRAKAMKFVDGLMIHSGDPVNEYVDMACRHVLLRQGVLGIKVNINTITKHLLKSIIITNCVIVTVNAEVDKLFLGVVHDLYIVNLNQIQTVLYYYHIPVIIILQMKLF